MEFFIGVVVGLIITRLINHIDEKYFGGSGLPKVKAPPPPAKKKD